MAQTKVAIFDLTGCEGCEFHLLSLDELLLDFFQDFEITHWRLLAGSAKTDFDIAFVEGAATTEEHINLLKQIRETSKYVVAIGACAISGNVFAQIPPEQRPKLAAKIYDQNYQLKAKFLEPVEKFIKVDAKVPGCPPNIEAFKKLLAQFKKEKVTSKVKAVAPPDYIAKIEGHGTLKVNFEEKKAQFTVQESERLVEGLLIGKDFAQAPFIASRICGICPIAHNLCSWAVLENALGIEPQPATIILRKILLSAQMIKSHLLHLFFLVLPDYAQTKAAGQLAQKYPAEFHLMLNLKRVADQALSAVGGSTAFPTNTGLSGFNSPPRWPDLMNLRSSIEEVLDEAEDLIKLFAGLEIPDFQSECQPLTITPTEKTYPFYPGLPSPRIKEIIQKGSTAKLGVLGSGKIVKGGALARIALYPERLNPKAKDSLAKHQFDHQNSFNNNLAQAIEILHFLEEIMILTSQLKEENLIKAQAIKKLLVLPKSSVQGEACLEAPRGILIHQVSLDQEGKITDYNIIPPTQINLASLQADAQKLTEKGEKRETMERLIRTFDPCITCAVH